MTQEFVPYELAVKLKELGFDFLKKEPCLAYYNESNSNHDLETTDWWCLPQNDFQYALSAPTFSQAFRWFREKYGLYGIPQEYTLDNFSYQIKSNREGAITLKVYGGYPLNYATYEEAELACLERLIELTFKSE